MNNIHDMGGMQGFGPVGAEPERDEPVFHADWERRAFALTLACGSHGRWNIDMSRHARERQRPLDYLRHSYYESWLAGLEVLLVDSGLLSAAELANAPGWPAAARTNESSAPGGPAPTDLHVLKGEDVAAVVAKGGPVTMDIPLEAGFRPGDAVRVRNAHPTGHTRAPRYVRGHTGTVEVDHGVHVFADLNARGIREGRHLYGVRFMARELWGPRAGARDTLRVDLWEDHLEPA